MWKYNDLDELYHHGILGMRWGVRRFKNKKSTNPHRKKLSQDALAAKKLGKKKIYEMSNDEIKTLNKRKQLETDYKRLNKNHIAKGMAIVGSTAAFTASVLTIRNNAPKLISDGKKAAKLIKGLNFN